MSLTEQQIAERFTGLGGSDAAPALGLSPWKTPLELFLDKREHRVPIANQAMRWGTILEPVIRQEYSTLTGRVVRQPSGTIRHPKHAWMIAHVDGVTDDRIFEAKTARSPEGWGQSGTEEVPHDYLVQVQHYMAVSGLAIADVAVLIGGSDFRVYTIPADTEMQELIVEGEHDFWQRVQAGTPPPPDFDAGDLSDLLKRLYPGTNGKSMNAAPTEIEFRRVYEYAANAAKNYERVADGAKQHLLYTMGESSRLVFPDGVQLTRKVTQRKGYTVDATEYLDARFSRIKETT